MILMNWIQPVLLTAVLTSLAASSALAETANSFAVRDVRVFDGEKTHELATVVVVNGRITEFAPGAKISRGLEVVDGRGKTLIPGLIDSHVHVFPGAQQDALRFGVTTELDMFDLSEDFSAWTAQRNSFAKTDQADTWAAGLGVTVKGGAPLQDLPPNIEVATLQGAADAKAFVAARVSEGSDYIKIFIEDLSEYHTAKTLPTLSRDEVCALIKAAHEDARMTVTHAQAEWAAREAIECGTDGLAHMFPDTVADADFIALASSRHVFVLTTDAVWAGVAGLDLAAGMAADPRVAPYLSAAQKQSLLMHNEKPHAEFFRTALENTRVLHEAGVALLAGTDSPNPATAHGVSLHEELQILVKAGFTPEQALRAATQLPAATFHLGGRGEIRVGARADLLLIEGNPTRDISATLSILRIWKNGYSIDRTPPKE